MPLLTAKPRGRWISICDFKGCLCLSVFVLSPSGVGFSSLRYSFDLFHLSESVLVFYLNSWLESGTSLMEIKHFFMWEDFNLREILLFNVF